MSKHIDALLALVEVPPAPTPMVPNYMLVYGLDNTITKVYPTEEEAPYTWDQRPLCGIMRS